MIVVKFGGTSVGDGDRIARVCGIVRGRLDRSPVVVTSALAGVTDLLERAIDLAPVSEPRELEPVLDDLERRHRWALGRCVENASRRHETSLAIESRFEELRQLLRSVRTLGEVTPRARDALLGFGEGLSVEILRAALAERGVDAVAVDARDVIVTDDRYGAAGPVADGVREAAGRRIVPIARGGRVPVIGGFVGATSRGVPTTLGRGGSDTTAAVLGAAIAAEAIEIWTDVDGLMSADPRIVGKAVLLESATFEEATESTHYGARVLHPAAVHPAIEAGIPVWIKNTFAADRPGTRLVGRLSGVASRVASIASREGVHVVRATSAERRDDASFALGALTCAGLVDSVPIVSTVTRFGFVGAFDRRAAAERFAEAFERDVAHGAARLDIEGGAGILAVVGHGIALDSELRRRVLASLGDHDPCAVFSGTSDVSVVALYPASRLSEAVKALHGRFFDPHGAGVRG